VSRTSGVLAKAYTDGTPTCINTIAGAVLIHKHQCAEWSGGLPIASYISPKAIIIPSKALTVANIISLTVSQERFGRVTKYDII
jgi:hypothetical protein